MTDRSTATPLVLGLVVCLLIIGSARLAVAPVFLYWPGPEWGKPVYIHPHQGARQLFGGPFYQLQAGRYRAAFRVRSVPAKTNSPLATLQVVLYSNLGTRVLVRDVIGTANNGDRYHEEEIAFTLPVAGVIETQAFYAGGAPLWIDGIRIWPDPRGPAGLPPASVLAASVGGLVLAFAVAYRKRRHGYLVALVLARLLFVVSALVLVARAGSAGALSPLDGSWLLPPYLWIVVLLIGAWLILLLVQWLSGTRDQLIEIAGALSDAIIIAVLIWSMPRLNFFSLAAIAVSAWMFKLALMVFALIRGRKDRALLAAIAISAYAFVAPLLWLHHYPTSGDETSYLVETLSLLRHRKINTWQVLQSGEYREFAPSADRLSLEIDSLTVGAVPGFPARDLGPSVFALPGYFLGGLDGARLGMEIVAVMLAGIVFALLRNLGVRWDACVLAWAGTCFSLPIFYYSSALYPELLGAALTAAGLLLLDRPLTFGCASLMGLCIGLLPTMNARYWALAAPLALLCLARLYAAKRWALLPVLAGAPLAIIAVEMCVNRAAYGIFLPNAGYFMVLRGASPAIYNQATPFARDFVKGWVGLWLDRQWGAFAGAPVFLLALAGAPVLWLRSRRVAMRALLLFAPYFIAVASTTFWEGVAAPPRYLIPVLPLCALPLAAILDTRFRSLAVALVAVGALTAMASLSSFDPHHTAVRLAARCAGAFGFTVASYLPSIVLSDSYRGSLMLIMPWTAGGLLLAVLGCRTQLSRMPKRSKAEIAPADVAITGINVRLAMKAAVILCLAICLCVIIARRTAKKGATRLSPTGGLDHQLTSFRENLTSTMTRLDLHPGQEIKVPVRIVDPGSETWASTGQFPVTISYRWFKQAEMLPIEGERTLLLQPIAPRESANVNVRVVAPNQPGDFTVRISLVQEGVAWFMTKSGTFLELTASVR